MEFESKAKVPAILRLRGTSYGLRPVGDNSWENKGTISSGELAGCSENEVRDEIGEAVVDCRRLGGELSGRFLLTFRKPPPERITLSCGLSLQVRQHTPAPLRCSDCFKYGIHERTCKGGKKCARCGKAFHGNECQACNGPHSVLSAECPIWKRELGIKAIMLKEKLAQPDAEIEYKSRNYRKPTVAAVQSRIESRPAPSIERNSYAGALTNPAPPTDLPTTQTNNQSNQLADVIAALIRLEQRVAEQNNLLGQVLQQNAEVLALLKSPQPDPPGDSTPRKRREAHQRIKNNNLSRQL